MDNLLIVFAKNPELGKVKTRLAASIGDQAAFDIYLQLLDITAKATEGVENCDTHIYFTSYTESDIWKGKQKFLQTGNDLGERMQDAFQKSFDQGYKRVIGIGTDLPSLSSDILSNALRELEQNDTVFGPSEDGGYYLLGMSQMIDPIFENKPWSTEDLLDLTIKELKDLEFTTALLERLNDVDTLEDLKRSELNDNQ
jgi:rSAM/selenodomain-associated transferase 1